MKTFPLHVIIVQCQAKKFTLQVNQGMPVATLKGTIQGYTSILSQNQRLIYAGKEMKDTKLLRDYGVAVGMTVHCAQRGTPVSFPIVENSLQEMHTKLENERLQKEKEKTARNETTSGGSNTGNKAGELIDLEVKDMNDTNGDVRKPTREQKNEIIYATSLHDSVIEDGRGSPNENVNNNSTQMERSNKRKRENSCNADYDMRKNVEIIIDEDDESNLNIDNSYGSEKGKINMKTVDRRSESTSSSGTFMPIYSKSTSAQIVSVNPTIILDSDDDMSEIELKGKDKDRLKEMSRELDDSQNKHKKRKKVQQPQGEPDGRDDDDDVILVL